MSLSWDSTGLELPFGKQSRPLGFSLNYTSGCLFYAGGWPVKSALPTSRGFSATGAGGTLSGSLGGHTGVAGNAPGPGGVFPAGTLSRRAGSTLNTGSSAPLGATGEGEVEDDRLQGRFTISRLAVTNGESPVIALGSPTPTAGDSAADKPSSSLASAAPPETRSKASPRPTAGGPVPPLRLSAVPGAHHDAPLSTTRSTKDPVATSRFPERLGALSLIVTAAPDRAGHLAVSSSNADTVVYFGGESVRFGSSGELLNDVILLDVPSSRCKHVTRPDPAPPSPATARASARGKSGGAGKQANKVALNADGLVETPWPCPRKFAAGAMTSTPDLSATEEGHLSSRIARSNAAAAEKEAKAQRAAERAEARAKARAGAMSSKTKGSLSSTPTASNGSLTSPSKSSVVSPGRTSATGRRSPVGSPSVRRRRSQSPLASARVGRESRAVVLLFGGEDADGSVLGDLWEFRISAREWVEIESLGPAPCARKHHSMVATSASHGVVVLFGGHDGTQRLNDLHVYNADTRVWVEVVTTGPAPTPRCMHSMCLSHPGILLDPCFKPIVDPGSPSTESDPGSEASRSKSGASKKGSSGGGGASPRRSDYDYLPADRFLMFGGSTTTGPDAALHCFCLREAEWRVLELEDAPSARYGHCLVPIALPEHCDMPFTQTSPLLGTGFRNSPSKLMPSHLSPLPAGQRPPVGFRYPPVSAADVGQHHVGVPLDLRSLTGTFSVELEPIHADTFRELSPRPDAEERDAAEKAAEAARLAADKAASKRKRANRRSPTRAISRPKAASPARLKALSAAGSSDAGNPSPRSCNLVPGWKYSFLVFGGRDDIEAALPIWQLRIRDGISEGDASDSDCARSEVPSPEPEFVVLPCGDKYIGDILHGNRHGIGECIFVDGSRYVGQWQDDLREGQGECWFPDGTHYKGNWGADGFDGPGSWTSAARPSGGSDSKVDDAYGSESKLGPATSRTTARTSSRSPRVGVLTGRVSGSLGELPSRKQHDEGVAAGISWDKGLASYTGEWCDGQKYGQGRAEYFDGSSYEGEWAHDVPADSGTYRLADGSGWTGMWVKGVLQGEGKRWCRDGEVYEGNFLDGVRHGFGTCSYSDGSEYSGQWRGNRRNGTGDCTFATKLKYSGKWVADLPNGRGVCVYPTGHVYDGTWRNGLRHGTGSYMTPDGSVYKGDWRNGLRHGKGVETRPDGMELRGEWHQDEFTVMTC